MIQKTPLISFFIVKYKICCIGYAYFTLSVPTQQDNSILAFNLILLDFVYT